jgi:tRNA G18 (ribose-2'-O)-methylase SpoU
VDKYSDWERNVIDEYKSLSNEEIRRKVEANQLPFAVLMTHINIDYNLGAVLRVSNALGAKVFYFGHRKWDRRSAAGVHHYTPIVHLPSIEDVKKLKKQYQFVALEQTKRSIPLHKFTWPKQDNKQTLIIIGEESRGLQATPEILELADYVLEIIQKGSVRSLNAATAFAIAAYDFSTKYAL